MISAQGGSARRFAVISIVLAALGTVTLAVGVRASGWEVLAAVGVLLLLAAPVVGMVALVLAVVGRVHGGTVGLAALAVLAPVIALAWLLFPAFRSAQSVARQRLCMQHLKTLSMARMLYMEDWNERYPPARSWSDCLRPYMRSMEEYRCPAAPRQKSGYAFNLALDCVWSEQVAYPDKTVVFYDATGGWNLSGGQELIARRHHGGANFAFGDGHVQYVYRTNVLRWKAR